MAQQTTSGSEPQLRRVLDAHSLRQLQGLVRRVPVAQSLVSYAVRLVRATRPSDADAPPEIRRLVSWGAGPRASQYLHRVVTNFQAEAEGRTPADLVEELILTSRKWT